MYDEPLHPSIPYKKSRMVESHNNNENKTSKHPHKIKPLNKRIYFRNIYCFLHSINKRTFFWVHIEVSQFQEATQKQLPGIVGVDYYTALRLLT